MPKKARANRRANERRREEARLKQLPLPIDEQHARRAARLAAHAARYPTPPNYGTIAYGAAATGVATAAAITSDASADASGTAGHFRCKDSADAVVFDGTCGHAIIVAGGTISISSATVTFGPPLIDVTVDLAEEARTCHPGQCSDISSATVTFGPPLIDVTVDLAEEARTCHPGQCSDI